MWAAHFITYDKPRTWLNSGGLGTMGYTVPAALGARLGTPDREVWAIDGDGCFQMTNQETGHRRRRRHPRQGRDHQQRQPRHGPATPANPLPGPLFERRPRHPFAAHPGLSPPRRSARLHCEHEADLEETIAHAPSKTVPSSSTSSSTTPPWSGR
ncbi:hypothetical protein BKE56_010385 [Rhodococcus sp. M8]|nr:hypothetical protein BKE56_010385 [Rhodococcus sp. M8]